MNYAEAHFQPGVCGKRHAYCSICRPEVVGKIRSANHVGKGRYVRSPTTKLMCRRRFQEQARLAAARRTGVPLGTETKAKISASLEGRPLSEECKQKIAEGVAAAWAGDGYQTRRSGPTSLEYALQMLLEGAEVAYEAQVGIGRYIVDFWLPSHTLAFEADGRYWHALRETQSPGHHNRRDSYLKRRGVVEVVHLDDDDLAPWVPCETGEE